MLGQSRLCSTSGHTRVVANPPRQMAQAHIEPSRLAPALHWQPQRWSLASGGLHGRCGAELANICPGMILKTSCFKCLREGISKNKVLTKQGPCYWNDRNLATLSSILLVPLKTTVKWDNIPKTRMHTHIATHWRCQSVEGWGIGRSTLKCIWTCPSAVYQAPSLHFLFGG